MPSPSSVQSPRPQPMPVGQSAKQLGAAHARKLLPAPAAPKHLDVLAQAAAMRAYVLLYETQCRHRSVAHMRHRHALMLLCQGTSLMGALVQSGLSGSQVAMLLPALYDWGAPGVLQWLTQLDVRLARAQRAPVFKPRPGPSLKIAFARPAPPASISCVLPLPRRTGLPAPRVLQAYLDAPTSVLKSRAQAMWEAPRKPGPRRLPSAEQKRDFVAFIDSHVRGTPAQAAASIVFLMLLCEDTSAFDAGDMAGVDSGYASILLERLADLGPERALACMGIAALRLSPPSLVPNAVAMPDARMSGAPLVLPQLQLGRLERGYAIIENRSQCSICACLRGARLLTAVPLVSQQAYDALPHTLD